MNNLLEENDEDIEDRHARKDREITLGTTMVLGIFFALAVFGAVMFGFGYSIGTRHVAPVAQVAATESSPGTNFSGFKPPSGKSSEDLDHTSSAQSTTLPLPQPPAAPLPDAAKPALVAPAPLAAPAPQPGRQILPSSRATPVLAQVPAVPVTRTLAPPSQPAPAVTPGGTMMVQIAAVSHQEDADLLLSTLRRRNYAVAAHSEPQDHLLHIQIGPYATRKDADAMRLRLQADGFNAIVKDTSR